LASLQSEPVDNEMGPEKAEDLLSAMLIEGLRSLQALFGWYPAQRAPISFCFNYCFLTSGMFLVSSFLWA